MTTWLRERGNYLRKTDLDGQISALPFQVATRKVIAAVREKGHARDWGAVRRRSNLVKRPEF